MACELCTSSGWEEGEKGRRQEGLARTICPLLFYHIHLPVAAIARGVREGVTMCGTRVVHGIGKAR